MEIASLIILCTVLLTEDTVLNGPTNAFGKTDEEKIPITDSWLKAKSQMAQFTDAQVEGQQLDSETTKGVVILRGKVNSDAAMPGAEDVAKAFSGVKNDSKVVAPPVHEAVEDSTAMDAKERAAKIRGLHAKPLKLMIMNSLFLSLMKP